MSEKGKQHRDWRSPKSRIWKALGVVSGLHSTGQRERSVLGASGKVRQSSSPREGEINRERRKQRASQQAENHLRLKASPGIADKGPQVTSRPVPWPSRMVRLKLCERCSPDSV